MATGPCPNCGVSNKVFFGGVLGVEVCCCAFPSTLALPATKFTSMPTLHYSDCC